jgi:SAM-dependent methyltransferase
MKEISNCEVCGNKKLSTVLNLGLNPLCDDLVSIGSDRICKEYPIEILYCEICFTAHQRFQVPKQELFTDAYHYRARMTGSVLSGMSELVDSIERRLGSISEKTVLDIGCNDGSLLNYFELKGCRTIGVEPTRAALESGHKTINTFFDNNAAKMILKEVGQPDIITFTNVFAHIENLAELLENLSLLLNQKTVVIIENHYLGAILDSGQFDTFYHEHPRTYSQRSFEYIAKSLNLNLVDVQFVSRYGGNIRAYLGHGKPTTILVNENHFGQSFSAMTESIDSWKLEAKKTINNLVGEFGPIRAKAFPGRAAIMIQLLGLTHKHISAVYEIIGSIKVGHYVPGTRIPILPEADLFASKDLDKPIINLAWHIPAEVRANLSANGYTGRVIDINEFKGVLK